MTTPTSGGSILAAGATQNHNFCPVNDVDWVKINLVSGKEYLYMVSSKGGEAGMKVQLYASNQTTLLKEMLLPQDLVNRSLSNTHHP